MELPSEKVRSIITIPECGNVITLLSNFHSIICQVVAYGRLKTKEYKSGHGGLQEIPNKDIRQGNFWYFRKLEETWSLSRGDHNQTFNCSMFSKQKPKRNKHPSWEFGELIIAFLGLDSKK